MRATAPGARPARGAVLVLVARDTDNPQRAGGDRHVCLLAEELASRGHPVTVLCASHPSLPTRSERHGVRIERVAPIRLLGPVLWARLLGGAAAECELVIEEMVGGARIPFLAPLLTRRPVLGFWYQDNTAIFHAQYRRPLAMLAGVVQRFILSVHRGSAVACPSEMSRDWLVSQGYEAERVGVFHPSADPLGLADPTNRFEARRNRLVGIGNIRPLKRFEEAIDVLAQVRLRVPDAELAIIGRRDDDEYLRSLTARAERAGVRGAVRFLLDIPEEQKYRVLSEAKVLTIHSAIEGFGLTVAEAGLCGVPCVVNSGVPPDVLEDGVNGVRVPQGDVEAFAREIVRLMANATEWTRTSDGARRLALRFKTPRMDATLDRILTTSEGGHDATAR